MNGQQASVWLRLSVTSTGLDKHISLLQNLYCFTGHARSVSEEEESFVFPPVPLKSDVCCTKNHKTFIFFVDDDVAKKLECFDKFF